MRVTGGTARGVQIHSPSAKGVRPTTDRVRSALFNILASKGIEGLAVVDLYAGTGSVGIEALSRGASRVEFVENNRRQASDILKNVSLAKVGDRAVIHCSKAADPFPVGLLEQIFAKGLLNLNSLVVVGHSSRKAPPSTCGELNLTQDRQYGDSGLAFYANGQKRSQN